MRVKVGRLIVLDFRGLGLRGEDWEDCGCRMGLSGEGDWQEGQKIVGDPQLAPPEWGGRRGWVGKWRARGEIGEVWGSGEKNNQDGSD